LGVGPVPPNQAVTMQRVRANRATPARRVSDTVTGGVAELSGERGYLDVAAVSRPA